MDLKGIIEAGSESATSLIERAAHAAEDVSVRATEAVAVAKEQSGQAIMSAEQRAASWRRSSRKPLIIGAAALAAAGAGLYLWKRRQAAAAAHLSGETEWATDSGARPSSAAPAAASTFQPGVADEQSPDVVDEEFAHEVDEAADELAEEIVDAIEVPADAAHRHVEEAPEPAAPFVAGVADEQSPDAADAGFAAEVDSAADQIATSVVDAIEPPEGHHR
ncbi:MAG TPA: hypothetical protein VES03_06480 [Motilibacterales bacterium]|nr:hypothetical protein [Motilibacterales bacterium]